MGFFIVETWGVRVTGAEIESHWLKTFPDRLWQGTREEAIKEAQRNNEFLTQEAYGKIQYIAQQFN